MPTRLTLAPTLSHGCQQSYIEFLALPPLLFALQAERLFLVSANSDKTPHHTHLQHAKISLTLNCLAFIVIVSRNGSA